MRCADQKYVSFDLEKVKDSMKDAKMNKQGIQYIVVVLVQATTIILYTFSYKALVTEQQKVNAELFTPAHGQPYDQEEETQ